MLINNYLYWIECVNLFYIFSAFYQNLCGNNLTQSIQHPMRENERLFLLFDTTHNMKNVYNNWVSKTTFRMPKVNADLGDIIPSDAIVSFNHVKRLYEKEETNVIKVAHALKENALHPSNIQKISPKLALCKCLLVYTVYYEYMYFWLFVNFVNVALIITLYKCVYSYCTVYSRVAHLEIGLYTLGYCKNAINLFLRMRHIPTFLIWNFTRVFLCSYTFLILSLQVSFMKVPSQLWNIITTKIGHLLPNSWSLFWILGESLMSKLFGKVSYFSFKKYAFICTYMYSCDIRVSIFFISLIPTH